jgi:hypothetical protein
MRHADGRGTTVPVHQGRDVAKETLRGILADVGMARKNSNGSCETRASPWPYAPPSRQKPMFTLSGASGSGLTVWSCHRQTTLVVGTNDGAMAGS